MNIHKINYVPVSECEDGDGHLFLIPQGLVDEFYEVLENCEAQDNYEDFQSKFGKYSLGGANPYQLYADAEDMKKLLKN